ncbi:metallophosphoesterase family protein, partial [bacterium]|nr:metallophosphoesterase family protein [bacterium]
MNLLSSSLSHPPSLGEGGTSSSFSNHHAFPVPVQSSAPLPLRSLLPLLLLGLWACGENPPLHPSLAAVGPDRATIAWTTPAPADSIVEWSTGEPQGRIRIESSETSHAVRLTGLQPDTLYYYHVRSGSAASAMHSFRTAPAEFRPFTFAFCGDGGAADALLQADPAFVCHAGSARSPLRGSRPVLAAQAGSWRSFVYLNVETFVLDAAGLQPDDAQWRWIQAQLAQSRADWKVVLCRPSPLTDAVRPLLLPLLIDGGVDLVLSDGGQAMQADAWGQGQAPGKNAVTLVTASAAEHSFLLASVARETLVLHTTAADGSVMNEATLRKERGKRTVAGARAVELLEVAPAFQPAAGFDVGAIGKKLVTKAFAVSIANAYSRPLEGELRWDVHPNTTWSLDPPLLKIAIPPRSRRTYRFSAGIVAPDIEPAPTFTFTCGAQSTKIETSPFRFTLAPS